jgi:hypothetical protein
MLTYQFFGFIIIDHSEHLQRFSPGKVLKKWIISKLVGVKKGENAFF